MERPHLGRREAQVVRLISLGCTSKEIAAILGIAKATADNYKAYAKEKFGTDRSILLARLALKYKYTTMNDKLTPAEKRKSGRKNDGWS